MSALDLDALQALADVLPFGEWAVEHGNDGSEGGVEVAPYDCLQIGDEEPIYADIAVLTFIAASREAVPALIAELRKARKSLEWTDDVEGLIEAKETAEAERDAALEGTRRTLRDNDGLRRELDRALEGRG